MQCVRRYSGSAKKVIFSGIQSSGIGHLGNYLGAVKNWAQLQDKHPEAQILYSVVDLHAITVPQNPEELRNNTISMLALLMACGINPKRSLIFQQSKVQEHAELAWILGCLTPTALLNRMTQWKSKQSKVSCLGLFSYPVLMAADILLYKTSHVPVGEDNLQHLELSRDIVTFFNTKYQTPFFPRPDAILGEAARVMSLRTPTTKMSKSDPSELSRINMTDCRDDVYSKIRRAVTDERSEITFDPEQRPGVSNLVQIYAALSNKTTNEVVDEFRGQNTLQFKEALAVQISNELQPIQDKMQRLLADPGYIDSVNAEGSYNARKIASSTMHDVKTLVGLL